MGVSIHYRGKLNDRGRLLELRCDLLHFAARASWQFLDLTGPRDTQLLEIILYPPGQCEPVFLLFDSEGSLHPAYKAIAQNDGESPWCSVKTQNGPLEAHVQIVELLRHLKQNYIPDLEVSDEGHYWETENPETLRATRKFLSRQPP